MWLEKQRQIFNSDKTNKDDNGVWMSQDVQHWNIKFELKVKYIWNGKKSIKYRSESPDRNS